MNVENRKREKEQILGNLLISYSIFLYPLQWKRFFSEGTIRKFFENNFDIKQKFKKLEDSIKFSFFVFLIET